MLVLSRNPGEVTVIVMDGKVLAKIIYPKHHKQQIKLGFSGKKEVKFYREEVWNKIKGENFGNH